MKKLLVISSAPVQEGAAGQLLLDRKFLDGMKAYAAGWDGPVHCILQNAGRKVPFGLHVARDSLPFDLTVVDPAKPVTAQMLRPFDVVLCSGDSHRYFDLADLCASGSTRLYYIIEYILETRLQIVGLNRNIGPLKRAYTNAWTVWQERRRRRAFRRAAGLQANGYPAAAAYGPLNANTLRYLDNRVGEAGLARSQSRQARREHLASDGPLRLIHSGRLARMKGSQDLIPIAKYLCDKKVNFRLDIFGNGPLEEDIRAQIAAAGLGAQVILHGTVDFQTELIPFTRDNSDIFLSCHRQSDPSCSYLESMGCGIAVAGYSNRMWQALQEQSQAGWVAPLGNWQALAETIVAAAHNRDDVARRCDAALAFAKMHTFEMEFGRRLAHLEGADASDT